MTTVEGWKSPKLFCLAQLLLTTMPALLLMLHQSAFPTHASFHPIRICTTYAKSFTWGSNSLPTQRKLSTIIRQRIMTSDSEVVTLISTTSHPTEYRPIASSDKANITTSSGRSREAIHRSQNWTLSSPPPCLEILSMKITNRTGDKGQPWWSPTPTETCSGGSDARSVHPHKTFWFTRRSVRLC